ncbi:MAG: oligoendopeptidase F [Chloroflexi bacterium]|jgi:oligoendopeptidase F|nr:oligoendopeptidase F [Chloroflexota bacterium]
MKKAALPPRSEVPIHETWDLKTIFPDERAWQVAKEAVLEQIPELIAYKGKLSLSPHTLADFFDQIEKTMRLALKVAVYGNLSSSVDTSDQEALALSGQGQSMFIRLQAATSFLEPELMAIGFVQLRKWIKQEHRLSYLSHYIDELERQTNHVRSGEVEEVLALAGEPLGAFFRAYNALTNADLAFENAIDANGNVVEVGQSSIDSLVTNSDRTVRKTSYENYTQAYLNVKNTLAAVQAGGIYRDVYNARTRNYQTSLEASLGANNIPLAVFSALLSAFKENLPTWHRYWKIRKKALGYDQLHVYDIKAPLTTETPQISFEQAVEWICSGMAPLGKEYVAIMRKGALEDRWVDRAVNRGKRQGAFSSGAYDTNPFLMLSYADSVFSMSTLAHELGHSMHSYYTFQSQPFIYSRYSLFVAEVASNFNQAMVRNYMFDTQTDPYFQLALIEEAMSNFHRYFFIMPTLARWELEVHQRAEVGKPLTADIMSDVCAEYFSEGYGDDVVYDRDQIGITWAQFQHMYMNFYVYNYATGISAAHALVDGIQQGGQEEVDRYIEFLKAGSSIYPLNALKLAGVDMTSPDPVNRAFEDMARYIDRLEQLVESGAI